MPVCADAPEANPRVAKLAMTTAKTVSRNLLICCPTLRISLALARKLAALTAAANVLRCKQGNDPPARRNSPLPSGSPELCPLPPCVLPSARRRCLRARPIPDQPSGADPTRHPLAIALGYPNVQLPTSIVFVPTPVKGFPKKRPNTGYPLAGAAEVVGAFLSLAKRLASSPLWLLGRAIGGGLLNSAPSAGAQRPCRLCFFLPLQLLEILGCNCLASPFWATKRAAARCGLRQISSEFSSNPYFLPPFISKTNLEIGASGTASNVLRIPLRLFVSTLPLRRIRTWPFRSATRAGSLYPNPTPR